MARHLARAGLALAVTALCLAVLARDLDLAAWRDTLADVAPMPLAVALVVALALPFWRAARLAALLPAARRPGRGVLTRIAAEVLLWNLLLPFKLGELSFPWLLHRRADLPLAEAGALFVLVRVSDLAAVAGLLLVSGAALPPVTASGWAPAAVVLGLAALVAPVLLVVLAGRWHARLAARGGRLARFVEGAAHARGPRARFVVALTTLAIWGSHALVAALAATAVGVEVGAIATLAASAAGNLAFALPVSGVLGLGPQQVAFAATLDLAGVAWMPAVATAVCVYLVVTVAAAVAGLASWLSFGRGARPAASARRRTPLPGA